MKVEALHARSSLQKYKTGAVALDWGACAMRRNFIAGRIYAIGRAIFISASTLRSEYGGAFRARPI